LAVVGYLEGRLSEDMAQAGIAPSSMSVEVVETEWKQRIYQRVNGTVLFTDIIHLSTISTFVLSLSIDGRRALHHTYQPVHQYTFNFEGTKFLNYSATGINLRDAVSDVTQIEGTATFSVRYGISFTIGKGISVGAGVSGTAYAEQIAEVAYVFKLSFIIKDSKIHPVISNIKADFSNQVLLGGPSLPYINNKTYFKKDNAMTECIGCPGVDKN
jgi:hypothetical protein